MRSSLSKLDFGRKQCFDLIMMTSYELLFPFARSVRFENERTVWDQVRDDKNTSVDWMIVGYREGGRTDVGVLLTGTGGLDGCVAALPRNEPVFGGCRLVDTGRFVRFFYAGERTSVMAKGRASMHKNGVLNVFEGSDREIDVHRGLTVLEVGELARSPTRTGNDRDDSAAEKPSVSERLMTSSENDTDRTENNSSSSLVTDNRESTSSLYQHSSTSFYPIERLKNSYDLPAGVNPATRELSLSDQDFMDHFEMNKVEFGSLPGWKRTQKKKLLGLF